MHCLVFDKRIPFWPEKGGPKFGLPCFSTIFQKNWQIWIIGTIPTHSVFKGTTEDFSQKSILMLMYIKKTCMMVVELYIVY